MGTNYYLHRPDEDPLHIGKSSVGWCFSLHVIPEKGINDLQDWVDLWQAPGARIEDEYGRDVPPDKMFWKIAGRSRASDWAETEVWPNLHQSEEAFHSANHSERGPNGLLRSQIGRYCVSHGAGSWDCFVGEFS